MPAYRPIEERFAEKYKVTPGGCWEWQATRIVGGYGMLRGPNRTNVLAHRFSFANKNGPIPTGMIVCHKCDNPPCVNPEHLFLATHRENMKDMEKKGRARLLSQSSVDEARSMLTSGYSQTWIAQHFGVARATIARSIARDHEDGIPEREEYPDLRYTKLSDERRAAVRDRLASGLPIAIIAREFSVDRKTVRNIRDKL